VNEARYASRDNERFYAAGDVDESHPAVARVGKFDDVKFYQISRIEAGKDRVVAKLTDGAPLLVEKKVGVPTAQFDCCQWWQAHALTEDSSDGFEPIA